MSFSVPVLPMTPPPRCRASGAGQRSGGLLPVLQAVLPAPPVGRPAAGPHAGRPRPGQQPEPTPDLRRHGGRPAQVLLHQAGGPPGQSEWARGGGWGRSGDRDSGLRLLSQVITCAWCSRKALLATSGSDGTVRVWSVTKNQYSLQQTCIFNKE